MTPTPTTLTKSLHVSHLTRCITGLPGSRADLDTSRLGIAYYTLSALDLLGALDDDGKVKETDKKEWRDWIWALSVQTEHGFGFRPGTSLYSASDNGTSSSTRYDPPHLIMTYTALLSLSILRDDFSQLDREGLANFLSSTQHEDGSFSPLPIGTISSESDLRLTFCTFAICSMLDDWSCIDVNKAVQFVARCRTYEGGYGEAPGNEANGGPTYCALACLSLAAGRSTLPADPHPTPSPHVFLAPSEAKQTVRWLMQRQKGGFQGRTEKMPDACYCFWCGAALKIMNSDEYVNSDENAAFLSACQFKYGGIAKEPGDTPDPYHTYLSLAALSLYPPSAGWLEEKAGDPSKWILHQLDPILNLRLESAAWARGHIPGGNR